MTGNREPAGGKPAAKAHSTGNGEPGVEATAVEADAERAREFVKERAWFLRQVCVDVPECAAVAVVLSDHCNRATGLMFPSIATLALAVGRSPRAVQPLLARLEKRKHIEFAGWVHLAGNANVKSWRWSLWDRRVEARFDSALIGDRSGRIPHDRKAPVRKKAAQAEVARSGRNTSAASEESGIAVMKDPACKPSSEPDSEPGSASPPGVGRYPKTKGEKKQAPSVTLHIRKTAEAVLRAAAPAVGRSYCRRRWPAELAQMEVEGIDARFVLAAVWTMSVRGGMPPAITSARYFLPLARELKQEVERAHDEFWLEERLGKLQWELTEARMSSAPQPTETAP